MSLVVGAVGRAGLVRGSGLLLLAVCRAAVGAAIGTGRDGMRVKDEDRLHGRLAGDGRGGRDGGRRVALAVVALLGGVNGSPGGRDRAAGHGLGQGLIIVLTIGTRPTRNHDHDAGRPCMGGYDVSYGRHG